MGRYKSKQPPTQPVQFPTSTPNNGGSPPQQMGMPPQPPADWPTTFNGPVIGVFNYGTVDDANGRQENENNFTHNMHNIIRYFLYL